jgi:hypothetical protein
MIFTAVLLSLSVSLATKPQPVEATSDLFALFSQNTVANLSTRGPAFPPSFDSNNFGMFYIVRGNWPIVLKYELAEGTARLEVKLRLGSPLRVELPATGKGDPRKISVKLPKEIGDVPQIAQLRLTARGPADLILHSLACGRRALVAAEETRKVDVTAENRSHFQPLNRIMEEVAIAGIVLSPPDVLNASQGAQLSFSFRSANDFPMWSATFQRQVRESGSRWQVERVLPFVNDPINQGQTKQNSWDGKNARGTVVGGRYKVMVSAWTSAAQDGSAVTSFSSPAITVK